jgi:hypothetical protein
MSTLLAGFAIGLFLAAHVPEAQVRKHGIRLLSDHDRHPVYCVFGQDPANWRNRRGPQVRPRGGRNTVIDFAGYFDGVTRDPAAMAALERGCADAGVPFDDQR